MYERDLYFFMCGFFATREGFNGECAYDHTAPDRLGEERGGLPTALEELLNDDPVLQKLRTLFREAQRHASQALGETD